MLKMAKRIGIGMDHFRAYLLESVKGSIFARIIGSESTEQEKESGLDKGEKFKNQREHQVQLKYYKGLIDSIKDFDKILLFGPAEAKN
jgi:hypothetical protein